MYNDTRQHQRSKFNFAIYIRALHLIIVIGILFQFKVFFGWMKDSTDYNYVGHADPTIPFPASIPALSIRSMASDHPNEGNPMVVITHSPHMDTAGTSERCECDLISIDCLASVRCLSQDAGTSQYFTALGVLTRNIIKRHVDDFYEGHTDFPDHPIGKALQYSAIDTWEDWIHVNKLPKQAFGVAPDLKSIFVDEKRYPYCGEHGLVALRCFFGDLDAEEEGRNEMERDALKKSSPFISDATKQDIERDVIEFLKLAKAEGAEAKKPPALAYLLSFAHIARIRYHRQPPLHKIYDEHIRRIPATSPPPSSTERTLRVSLHLRRADACEHAQENYTQTASDLDSPAQVSGKRLCYGTEVYMNALSRVQKLAKGQPRLDIYLSTDHAGSVMDDIRENFSDLYARWNWNVLDFSRDIFKYEGMIEEDVNEKKQGPQGETAVADLWHLSHGQVFIGHLGSRFGKVAWLLAMARHNVFVPFSTVDGHSFCCEVDEACAEVKPFISDMTNCMTFHHDDVDKTDEDRKLYWEIGSQSRKRLAERKKDN